MTRTYATPAHIGPCNEATWRGHTVPEVLLAAGAYLRQRPDWDIQAIRLDYADAEETWYLTVTFEAPTDRR